jgi:hypothetical protein
VEVQPAISAAAQRTPTILLMPPRPLACFRLTISSAFHSL